MHINVSWINVLQFPLSNIPTCKILLCVRNCHLNVTILFLYVLCYCLGHMLSSLYFTFSLYVVSHVVQIGPFQGLIRTYSKPCLMCCPFPSSLGNKRVCPLAAVGGSTFSNTSKCGFVRATDELNFTLNAIGNPQNLSTFYVRKVEPVNCSVWECIA